jgi:His-Xaa-Ser system radical SAM maturase HxsC
MDPKQKHAGNLVRGFSLISLATYGRPIGFAGPLVARVARNPEPDAERQRSDAIVTDGNPLDWVGAERYRAIVTSLPLASFSADRALPKVPIVHSAKSVEHLKSGDVIVLTPQSGRVRTIFRPDSLHNFLFATERCNSFCLMCSQPPVDRDDAEQVQINLEAIRLMEPAPSQLGITGGEPTLLRDGLFKLMAELKARLPQTNIHMLTNGRRFAWPDFTEAFMAAAHPRLTVGIPLYSDNAPEHDYVVQARGAFDQTIQGLHRLARYEQAVEIRVVLHKLTIPRLDDLAQFIYRNLPFASHVALMGLEITGFTRPNLTKLWIDPYEYQRELHSAVEYLAIRDMNVSIYNHPLCLLPGDLWQFAKRSISDWKNLYLEVCQGCGVRERCGGFFMSAERQHSSHLHPVVAQSPC